jgi:hypothetical protein
MKKILFLLLTIASVYGCEKDEPESYSPSLIGEWSWFISTGGIVGVIIPDGVNTVNLLFTPDSILYTYRNDTIYSFDPFHTYRKVVDNGSDTIDVISIGSVIQKYFIFQDTLVLEHINAPMGSGYVRIKQVHFP